MGDRCEETAPYNPRDEFSVCNNGECRRRDIRAWLCGGFFDPVLRNATRNHLRLSVDSDVMRLTEFQAHNESAKGIAVLGAGAGLLTIASDGSCRHCSLQDFPDQIPSLVAERVFLPESGGRYRLECRSLAVNTAHIIAAVAVGPEEPEHATEEDWNELYKLEDTYGRIHLLSIADLSDIKSLRGYEVSGCGFAPDDSVLVVLHRHERVTVIDIRENQIRHDLDYAVIYGVTSGSK